MTKKQALEETFAMWKWLSENPSSSKGDYIRQLPEADRTRIGNYDCECPCCEYDIIMQQQNKLGLCANCPIWSNAGFGLGNRPCIYDSYGAWSNARVRLAQITKQNGDKPSEVENEIRMHAGRIAQLAQEKLDELMAEEKAPGDNKA